MKGTEGGDLCLSQKLMGVMGEGLQALSCMPADNIQVGVLSRKNTCRLWQ